jgi:hypothetical protein
MKQQATPVVTSVAFGTGYIAGNVSQATLEVHMPGFRNPEPAERKQSADSFVLPA